MKKRRSTPQVAQWLPGRTADAHKGDFGHALIVAGSKGMAGAAILAARAASRAGAGLVTLAVPENLQPVVAGHVPEAMTLGLPEVHGSAIAPEACGRIYRDLAGKRWNVLAIGPGLGTDPTTERALIAILGRIKLPAVIDADGLNLLSRHGLPQVRKLFEERQAPCVLTPHPGEMARLLSWQTDEVQSRREEAARTLARALGCVCLLKGKGTIITDGERMATNPTGNPGLAKGGSGDVLTGVIAGLWAQRLKSAPQERGFEVAALGAWLHGAAADEAVKTRPAATLLASDVVEALPAAFRRLAA